MEIGFSEFTFGFAFLHEQTVQNWPNLTACPILPSLQEEADEGWDAHLPVVGTDFYYQFKVSEYLFRSNALYIQDATYTLPYYRIALHRRQNNLQHNRLRLLAQTQTNTFYVAPEINNVHDFNTAFLNQQLTYNSRLIPLDVCEDIVDGNQHYITYQEGNPEWIQHSEKKRHDNSFRSKDLEKVYNATRSGWKRIDQKFCSDLFESISRSIQAMMHDEGNKIIHPAAGILDFDPDKHTRRQVLYRASQLLSVFFGATLMLVGSRSAEK